MSALMPETDSEDELPPGWQEKATLEGEVYYANHLEKSTQWTHPRTGKRKEVSTSLPFGWERNKLPDGKIVYVNHDEQKTTYIDPRLAFAKEIHNNGKSNLENFRQRFDASSNALQVLHGQDLTKKVAIVTGSNHGGIGYEMARTLARSGCSVILACRDLSKAEISIGKIRSERANVKCFAMELNLASLKSVKKFADSFMKNFKALDILILNAGIFGLEHCMTEDNLELTFQVNYLSHYYLSHLLKPALDEAIMPKIVAISAESHRFSLIQHPEEFLSESILNPLSSDTFCQTFAYNDSKLFQLMFALEANDAWKNIRCIAVHPGNMISSRLNRHWWFHRILFALVRPFAKSLQQAAASGIFAAATPEMRCVGGIYINNCFPCQSSGISQDFLARRNLWMTSSKLLKDRGHFK